MCPPQSFPLCPLSMLQREPWRLCLGVLWLPHVCTPMDHTDSKNSQQRRERDAEQLNHLKHLSSSPTNVTSSFESEDESDLVIEL